MKKELWQGRVMAIRVNYTVKERARLLAELKPNLYRNMSQVFRAGVNLLYCLHQSNDRHLPLWVIERVNRASDGLLSGYLEAERARRGLE
jgi:hypothetical protein